MPPDRTVADYAQHWLATSSAPPYVTPYTSKIRRQFVELYLVPKLGELLMADVGTPELVALQHELFGRKLATSTVRHVFTNLVSPMWRHAKREGLISAMPDLDMAWPRPLEPKPNSFSVAERDVILTAFAKRGPSARALTGLVMLAGLRPSEAAALDWERVNIETGELRIDRSLVDGNFGPTKTAKAVRSIVVGDQLRKILAECRPERPASGALVCPNRFGGMLDARRWGNRSFTPSLRALKITARGFYCCRHTFISFAVSVRNANIAKVAAYCGTSVVMIEKHYLRHLVALTDPTRIAPAADL